MNTELNTSCRQFVGVYNGELVAHIGVAQFPLKKGAKRTHRQVVLPDYQGIGIGVAFRNAVCDIVRHGGWDGEIWATTTTPALYHALIRSPKWKLIRYGRAKCNYGTMKDQRFTKCVIGASSRQRITYSFLYVGAENKERLKPK